MNNKNNTRIIFDFNRTLYDPEVGALYSDARAVLEYFHKKEGCSLALVTLIEKERQEKIVTENLERYFQEIAFVTEKTPEEFRRLGEGYDAQKIWVVGDKSDSEILHGQACGFRTAWLRRGALKDHNPLHVRADYEIIGLEELVEIIC